MPGWTKRYLTFFDKFVPNVKLFLKKTKLPEKAILTLDNGGSHPDAKELRCGDI